MFPILSAIACICSELVAWRSMEKAMLLRTVVMLEGARAVDDAGAAGTTSVQVVSVVEFDMSKKKVLGCW